VYDRSVELRRYQAALGAILGGAVGDVLGGITERGALSTSDDTQLTLATCEAIVESHSVLPDVIAQRMLVWFREGRVTGIGSSTLKAMRDLDAGMHWALAGARGERAAGNGAAMRIAPLAFFLDPSNPTDRTKIRDVARITHHNDEASVGALAVVIAVRAAASGQLVRPENLAHQLPDTRVRDYLLTLAGHPSWTLEDIAREIGSSGYTPETIAFSVAAANRIVHTGIEATMHELNAFAGDADTIGSIAGQIAGAFLTSTNLRASVLARVRGGAQITEIAERFAVAAASSIEFHGAAR